MLNRKWFNGIAGRPVNHPVPNCRRLGLNRRDFLEDVLTRLPGMKASEAAILTLAKWLKARSSKAQRQAA